MKLKKSPMLEADFLNFVERFERLVKQTWGKHAGNLTSAGFQAENASSFSDFGAKKNTASANIQISLNTGNIRDVLELERRDGPDYPTPNKWLTGTG